MRRKKMLNIAALLISAILTAVLCVFTNAVPEIKYFYVPILIFIGCFIGVLLLFFAFLLVYDAFINRKKPVKNPKSFYRHAFNLVNEFLIFWSGARVKVSGLEKIDQSKKYLFVLNHKSNFDTMLLANVFKRMPIIFLSKPQNFKIPIAGGFIHKYGYLPVYRDDARRAVKMIQDACVRVEEGFSVGVCPEGTRNKTEQTLLPFKAGAFKIAKNAKIPVVVACVRNTEKISKRFPFRRTTVYVDILCVLSEQQVALSRTTELSEQSRDIILAHLEKTNGASNDL